MRLGSLVAEGKGWEGTGEVGWTRAARGGKLMVGSNGQHGQQGLRATVAGMAGTGEDQWGLGLSAGNQQDKEGWTTGVGTDPVCRVGAGQWEIMGGGGWWGGQVEQGPREGKEGRGRKVARD